MYRILFLCSICIFPCQEEENMGYLDFTPPQKQFVANFSTRNNIDLEKYCVEENPHVANSPQGVYSNKRGISGGETLTIKEDNVFEYSFQGCLGGSKSKGSWVQFGNTITLNSFPGYKRNFDYPDSISLPQRNFKEIQKTELIDWKLKIGKDFLISEGKGNSTYLSVYKKANRIASNNQ
jgi:hypothetical protein